jgi:serine/threonine-protein kinase ATR
MPDEEQIQLLMTIKTIPCAISGTLIPENEDVPSSSHCKLCDQFQNRMPLRIRHSGNSDQEQNSVKPLWKILTRLTEHPAIRSTKALRILLSQDIYRLINHCKEPERLDLSASQLGRWCVKSFQSSLRELRMVACIAITPFLEEWLPANVRHHNRSTFLELLRRLSGQKQLPLQETIMFAWGIIGRVCGETELNIALIELVKALGHPHPLVSAVAFTEIRRLSQHFSKAPVELFKPFWRSIAPEVVKDLFTCPQRAQLLSDVLELKYGVEEFLTLTESDTVPFLVLTKGIAPLQRIAQARKVNNVQSLIVESPRTLAAVVSRLLQESGDNDQAANALLQDVAPELNRRLGDLARIEPILSACEILKSAGDFHETQKPKVRTFASQIDWIAANLDRPVMLYASWRFSLSEFPGERPRRRLGKLSPCFSTPTY